MIPRVEFIKKKLEKYYNELTKIQDECQHLSYEILGNWNDHDGWSWVTINWYQSRRCKDCDKQITVKTGESRY